MHSLRIIVELASSGAFEFVTVALFLLASVTTVYFAYRTIRDLEVFILERKRLQDELIFKGDKTE